MGSVVMAMNSSSHFPASELEDKLDSYPGGVCGSPGAGWRQGWQGTGVEELPGPCWGAGELAISITLARSGLGFP